ncbi:MAG: hypothetical protein WC107_03870 [Patescibacteria group bacterium]
MNYNSSYHKKQKYQQQPGVAEVLIVGIFKMLWWLVRLPFRGLKLGVKKTGLKIEDRSYITSKRLEVEKMLNAENQIELKHAVMEADKLVDYALQVAGYPGQTFADRFRSVRNSISPSLYDEVWQGHIVRNQIAHAQESNIMSSELRNAARKLLNYLERI